MPRGNKTPFFSVIVPAYNVERYISECIESVLSQNFQDFELILVDDGSTDRTGEICDKFEDAIVIHQSNSGLSAARNAGVTAASGEYLIFLDGDDYLEQNALKIVHDNLEPNLDLLRFQAQEVFPDGKVVPYPEPGFAATTGVRAFRELARYHYTENAWLYAYRRNFFVENHFQYADGCIAEDFGLTPLILAKAQRVKAIPDICYDYRQREGSITRNTSVLRRTGDIEKQLQLIIPEIARIPGTSPILHFLVASFLTGAAALDYTDFSRFYRAVKQSGWLQYIHPGSLRALPRAFLLKYWPLTFYRLYHRDVI